MACLDASARLIDVLQYKQHSAYVVDLWLPPNHAIEHTADAVQGLLVPTDISLCPHTCKAVIPKHCAMIAAES